MTVDLVPSTDLVPSLASRIVTVNATDAQEGTWAAGESVRFRIVGDVHVPADRRIVLGHKGVTLPLPDGRGQVRLPVWTADTGEWAVEVKPSWTPHPYYIRVPAGSSSVDLSQINPLHPVDQAIAQWLLTNASVTATEGAAWGANVSVAGGNAHFAFTFPPGGTAFWRGLLTASAVVDDLETGRYGIPNAATATALGMPVAAGGVLDVTRQGTATGVQEFRPWTATVETYQRTRPSVPTWTAWARVGGLPVSPALGEQALDDLRTTGRYNQPLSSAATAERGYPDGVGRGFLDVVVGSPSYCLQVYYGTYTGRLAFREYYSGAWLPWREPAAEGLAELTGRVATLESIVTDDTGSALGVRAGEHEMRVEGLRQRIGRVHHPGKAVVALVFDHGSQNFQDIVLPKLRAHGLKSTLAMCSTHLTLEPAAEVDAWATIAGWAASDGVEIACHSKTHQDVTGIAALRDEIVTSRDELSANLGGLPVDSWVQPGARNVITPGATWDGFMDGQGAHRYTSTPAGEMIWNAYAMATGQVMRETWHRTYHCTGQPPLGPARRFIDAGGSQIATAKTELDSAAADGLRYIISLHPTAIGGSLPLPEFEDFIDYLAGRATAGEIELVQLREWALAEE